MTNSGPQDQDTPEVSAIDITPVAVDITDSAKPITIDVQLVGIGPNAKDLPTIGFSGAAKLKRSDFGLTTLLSVFGDDAELMIDTEFNREG